MQNRFNPVKAAAARHLRSITVEGEIKSCPPMAVKAHQRLIHKWEVLTGMDWEKEQKKREEKKA